MRPAVRAIRRSKAVMLCQEIARARGTNYAELLSPSRSQALCRIRWEVWYRCRHELGIGRTVMGRLFNRDKQTIFHGIRRHAERMKAEAANGSP